MSEDKQKKLKEEIELNISLIILGALVLVLINALDVIEKGKELAFVFVIVVFVLVGMFSGFVKKSREIIRLAKHKLKVNFVSYLNIYGKKLEWFSSLVYIYIFSNETFISTE